MGGSIYGNIISLLYFMFFQAVGVTVSSSVFKMEKSLRKLLIGSVLGSVMLQWIPALFSFIFGFGYLSHLLALFVCAVVSVICILRLKPKIRPELSEFCGTPFMYFIAAVTVFFSVLVIKSFVTSGGKVFSSQATYGDMSMHLGFITSIARQGSFPPEYSILPGQLLSYPFLSDSISSTLYLFGASLRFAYILPMLFAGAQVFFGFYVFAIAWLKSQLKAAVAWMFFFFNGGFGIFFFIGGGEHDFSRIFTEFYETPTNLTGENVRWVNVIVDMMLPQRATLFGWAILFTALYLLYMAVFCHCGEYFAAVGILAGTLPMIHTHSFLALGLISAGWLLMFLISRLNLSALTAKLFKLLIVCCIGAFVIIQVNLNNSGNFGGSWLLAAVMASAGLFCVLLAVLVFYYVRRNGARKLLLTWGLFLLITLMLTLPQLFVWTFRQAGADGFIRGLFGWVNQGDGHLRFWLKNLGIVGIIAFAAMMIAPPNKFFKAFPAAMIFFVAQLMIFQPNSYDNNKLLYPAYALLCCTGADFLTDVLKLIDKKALRRAALAAVLFTAGISAVLTMCREAVSSYELFGTGAVSLADYIEKNTEPDDIILTDTRHNNEVAALTGRNILCGSPSYLFYHGLNYYSNEGAAKAIYEAPRENWLLIKNYGVKYILISQFERTSYNVDVQTIESRCELAFSYDGIYLYRVRDFEA